MGWLSRLFSRGKDVGELARRLDLPVDQLDRAYVSYREFTVRKKSGKSRQIAAPNRELKTLQRRILRRVLAKLKTHAQATGFEPGVSFVDNARCHQMQEVIIRFDLVDFFPSISSDRVAEYFKQIGWDKTAATLLTKLTTHEGRLPQGAPTSPRLSNLVNYQLDSRLAKIADVYGGVYTRYADDITISMTTDNGSTKRLINLVIKIIRDSGYVPHLKKKFDVRRKHQRQVVTGMVVNQRANLPREKRRWLRAVKHRARLAEQGGYLGPAPTLSPEQLRGWMSVVQMIERSRLDR